MSLKCKEPPLCLKPPGKAEFRRLKKQQLQRRKRLTLPKRPAIDQESSESEGLFFLGSI